jgi:hypothetical protein
MGMNRTEYIAEIVRGHILITDDRGSRVLLDTGSPLSFHSNGIIALGGESFNVPTSLMGTDAGYVSNNVGVPIDGLVGMDILGCGVLIDVPAGRIVFGESTEGRTRVPSQSFFGYLSADMDIRGRRARMLIDTGAPTSYVAPSMTDGLPTLDTVTDFNPMVPGGTFSTPIFEFTASFAGQEFTMRAGYLPTILSAPLAIIGIDGIVGMELLKRQSLLIADGEVWV